MAEELEQSNPEVNAEVEGTDVAVDTPAPEQPTYYTVDEIKEAGLNLDIEKVHPDLRPWVENYKKSLQGDYTRKTQAVAEMAKTLQTQQVPQVSPDQQIFQEFIKNPNGVLSAIESRIESLDLVDPFETDNYKAARAEIRKLSRIKDDLILKRQQAIEMSVLQEKNLRTLKREGIDIEAKFGELLEVGKANGFTEQEITLYANDPRFAKMLSQLSEQNKAKQSVKGKEVKVPPVTETPGTGSFPDVSGNTLKTLLANATKTGRNDDWVAYFDAKTKLEMQAKQRRK